MYLATIIITRRPSILDPEGKAVEHALSLHHGDLFRDVRFGKYITLHVKADSEEAATAAVRQACESLLANAVMEDFTFTLQPVPAS